MSESAVSFYPVLFRFSAHPIPPRVQYHTAQARRGVAGPGPSTPSPAAGPPWPLARWARLLFFGALAHLKEVVLGFLSQPPITFPQEVTFWLW